MTDRFWGMNAETDDGHPEVWGAETVAIVDEEQGGVIAYAHQDNEHLLLDALRASTRMDAAAAILREFVEVQRILGKKDNADFIQRALDHLVVKS